MVTSARSLLCLGSVAGALGRLADLRGDRKLAAERYGEAVEREERAGALVWATHHRIRFAEALDDADTRRALLARAATDAAGQGLTR